MNLKPIFIALIAIGISAPSMSQNIDVQASEEMNATDDNALIPIGAHGDRLFVLDPGYSKKVKHYSLQVYDQSNINSPTQTFDLGDVLGAVSGHSVEEGFMVNDRIYLVSTDKGELFGNILSLEGKAIKSNIKLFGRGMSKRTVQWAELLHSQNGQHFGLACEKIARGRVEYAYIELDADLNAGKNHRIKPKEKQKFSHTTDWHLSNAGMFYVTFFGKDEANAYLYDLKSKKLEALPNGYDDVRNGQFIEDSEGTVWFSFMKFDDGVTGFNLVKHKAGSSPELVVDQKFASKTLDVTRESRRFGADPKGTYHGTELIQVVGKGNKHCLLFETKSVQTPHFTNYRNDGKDNSIPKTQVQRSIIVIGLENDAVSSEAVVHKYQILSYSNDAHHKRSAYRNYQDEDLVSKYGSLNAAFSIYAFEKEGKVMLIFNDARSNEAKNSSDPDKLNTLGRANLVVATVDGDRVTKKVLIDDDNYDIQLLPRRVLVIDNNTFFTTATSKRHGDTGLFLITVK